VRLVTYESDSGPRIAGARGDSFVDLHQTDPTIATSMKALLATGQEGLEKAREAIAVGQPFSKEGVKLLAPVPNPQKVICVGLNYADHAAESGMQPPPEPVLFSKFPSAIIGHGQPIALPLVSQQVDYEAELVAIIGRRGRNIPVNGALDYVAGYCPGHDVSARDWQLAKPGGQWLMGKTFDTFAPFGPELVTSDEVGDPGQLAIRLRLNGRVMQESTTEQFIFSVAEVVAYVSQVCTLMPGDVIFTGTPPGVGFARKPQVFLQPGDEVEVEIERLGTLMNPVIAGE